MQVSGPVKEDTVTGPKIAAVERREARVPGNNGTRHLHQVPVCYRSADPALRSLTHVREKKMQASPLRLTNAGADGARLFHKPSSPEGFAAVTRDTSKARVLPGRRRARAGPA